MDALTTKSTQKPRITFILSVDTEEEWDWRGHFPQDNPALSNINCLPAFQKLCDKLGIRPSYFVDYAVAENDNSAGVMQDIFQQGSAELGAHLHPWFNPPTPAKNDEYHSHVINLPTELVEQQLVNLTDLLKERFKQTPTIFRTGRWGINADIMALLQKHGFKIDSSVYPYYQNEHFSCIGAPEKPYQVDKSSPLKASSEGKMLEFPVTAGFNQNNFALSHSVHQMLSKPPLSALRPIGALWHTHLLRKIYLSPELHSVEDMLTLSDRVISRGHSHLHMFMHSSSLIDNPNSLLGNHNAFEFITSAIETYITRLQQKYTLEFCTLSEAAEKLKLIGEL